MFEKKNQKNETFGKRQAFLKNNMNLMPALGFSDRANRVIYGHFTEKFIGVIFVGGIGKTRFFEGILMVFSKQTSPHFLQIFLHPYSASGGKNPYVFASGGNKYFFCVFFMLQNAKSMFF